jgi:gluconate 5-dehydrogenase
MHPSTALFDLSGKIALVTGSSIGIGYGIARGLAGAGATVILNGRNADRLKEARTALQDEGLAVWERVFDVTDRLSVIAAIEAIEQQIGPIDILVNNAGIQRRGAFDEYPAETWHEIVAANLDSVFYVAQAVGRRMVTRRRGKIINICSVTSELGRATIIPYAATKGAVRMMTKGMCAEWAKYNIQINGIGPGYIKTDLNRALIEDATFSAWVCARTPAGRWAEIDELAGAAIFLASAASNYVNGHILYVDGGMSAAV